MEIQFLGATKTVTGSKYLLTSEKKILIDCGLFQGLKKLRLLNRDPFPVDPKTIDAVILTHAHLDHSGYLPVLVKNGFRGNIYGTKLTIELTKILLLDSGHIQEEEAAHANKHGYSKHKPALPLYTKQEAEAVFPYFKAIPVHQDFELGDFRIYFRKAGHIFGAVSPVISNKNSTIVFSGDLGGGNNPCVMPDEDLPPCDYLVVESTYGDRLHSEEDPYKNLATIIKGVIGRGGTLIIPSFAVGRTQTLLYYIARLRQEGKIPHVPVFLDSPMAQNVTDLVMESSPKDNLTIGDCQNVGDVAHYVNSVSESKKIDCEPFPKIIIAASGMLTGGRVLHHIQALAGAYLNAILLVGYQAQGTRGDALMRGKGEIKMFGKMVPINAEIISISSFSAHVDYRGMIAWLGKLRKAPRKVFITHGEEHAANALRDRIQSTLGWHCMVPDYLDKERL